MKNTYIAFLSVALVLLSANGITAQTDRGVTNRQTAEKRVALVIRNGAFTNTTPLQNRPDDAPDMARTSNEVGFEVFSGIDPQ